MSPLTLKLRSPTIVILPREDQGGDFPVAESVFIIQHKKLVNDREQIWRLDELSKSTNAQDHSLHFSSRFPFWLFYRSNVMDLYRGGLSLFLKSRHLTLGV